MRTMSVYNRLITIGITLPVVIPPVAAFAPWMRSGNLIWLSGHIARKDGRPWSGKLGRELNLAEGVAAARSVAIDLLGTLHAAAGNLDRVTKVTKIMVLVNSENTFTEQHLVANGASELLMQVFAEKGTHARSAFGVTQIPLGSCVEIELIAEVE
jgi:enamine deaminase RidA (YjgF/YER057c/UK114 family)